MVQVLFPPKWEVWWKELLVYNGPCVWVNETITKQCVFFVAIIGMNLIKKKYTPQMGGFLYLGFL